MLLYIRMLIVHTHFLSLALSLKASQRKRDLTWALRSWNRGQGHAWGGRGVASSEARAEMPEVRFRDGAWVSGPRAGG